MSVACPSAWSRRTPRPTRYEPVADCCFAARPSVATDGGETLAGDEARASAERDGFLQGGQPVGTTGAQPMSLARLESSGIVDPLRSPVVLDGVVSDEKLSELLALGTEYAELDFKATVDLTDTAQALELVRDVDGMLVRGGYMLIGIGPDAKPSGLLDGNADLQTTFDEAQLVAKLRKWIPEPVTLATRVTEREGHKVVLIYVAPHPQGCAILQRDGQFGGNQLLFKAGDVFWRDGTSTVRMSQAGFEEVVAGRIEAAKSEWMEEQREIRRREQTEYEAASRGSAALGSVNLDLEQSALNVGALELVRREDDIALRYLLNEAISRARDLSVRGEIAAELGDLLDRLTCVAATFLAYGRDDWFDQVIAVFVRIYSMPVGEDDGKRFAYSSSIDPREIAPRIWLQIIERIFGLGALAVREENWQAVRTLTLQQPRRVDTYERNWVRHTITMAARASHFQEQTAGQAKELSLLNLSRAVAVRLDCLRLDGVAADDDDLVTSLAAFDVLTNIVAVDGAGEAAGRYFYPNFSWFESKRVVPTVSRLLSDSDMRQAIFKGTDEQLAIALKTIGDLATKEGMRFFGFEGWWPEIEDFIAKNLPPAPAR